MVCYDRHTKGVKKICKIVSKGKLFHSVGHDKGSGIYLCVTLSCYINNAVLSIVEISVGIENLILRPYLKTLSR